MKIVLLGAPGAGKGTLASGLIETYKIPSISTGDLLRAEVKSGSKLGKECGALMEAGKLVPTETVLKMLKNRLKKSDTKNGYILDGFPRTLEQAELLEKFAKIDVCLNLVVDKQVIMDRICGRRTCKVCSKIYNTKTYSKDKCECGGELMIRADDNPETVAARFDAFNKNTAPLVDYYKKKGILINVQGKDKAADTLKDAIEVLNNVNKG